jgi:hypothetical protein
MWNAPRSEAKTVEVKEVARVIGYKPVEPPGPTIDPVGALVDFLLSPPAVIVETRQGLATYTTRPFEREYSPGEVVTATVVEHYDNGALVCRIVSDLR